MSDDIIQKIRDHQWRQGSILPIEAHSALLNYIGIDLNDDHACIVISQSCNLVVDDFEYEPNAEILVASRLTDLPDPNVMYCKSRRCLHVYILVDGIETPVGIWSRDRYNLPREILASIAPDFQRVIDVKNLRTLITWLTARYNRTAFPDNFGTRLLSIREKLKRAFDKMHDVSEIFIALNTWEELTDEQDYSIKLAFIMPSDKYEQLELRTEVQKNIDKATVILQKCKGISVDDEPILRSDDEFTLHEARRMSRWGDFDYLSYRDQNKHLLPDE